MSNIKKYDEFITENSLSTYSKSKMILLADVDLSNSDEIIMSQLLEKLYTNLSLTNRRRVDIFLEKNKSKLTDIINESFWDRFSSRIDKASEVSNILPDESEGILKKLIRKARQAMDFIGKILNSIREWISNIMKDVKDKITSKLKSDSKFSEAVKKAVSKDENGFIKDLETSNTVYKFYQKDLLGSFLKSIKTSLGNFFTKDQEPIPESFEYQTNEGKNVLSTFIHGIERIPPFSWLHKVASLGEKGANKITEGLSWITDKLGGPKFSLPTLAILLGIAFEYKIKGAVKHGILHILGNAFTGGLLSVISWMATFVAAIIVIDEIAGKNILGTTHH